MKKLAIETFGWYGAVVIILSYFLVTLGTISPKGFLFQFLNMSGGIGVMLVSLYHKTYQPVVINAFRAGVGLVAILVLILT